MRTEILNCSFKTDTPPSYDILLEVLKGRNQKLTEKEIIKEIKKLKIYDVPKTTNKSTKGETTDTSNVGNTDNV